ncbi:cytochrome c3 family protein [Phosphitispora sp. TUW77]|uniref:cytochrome c3 family protein n=1 Tax=Phosphitispora sp. TUW77 TaxID=3152361 RepID=UPI003AB38211
MKKSIGIIAIVVVALFMLSGVAFAENRFSDNYPKTHYGFSVSAEGCAGCHVIHTASVAKLLKTGNTQTDFCYSCHGSTTSSPYDVERGKIMGNDDSESQSFAGAFGFQGNDYYLGGTITSRHQVEGPTYTVVYAATGIPGNLDTGGDWDFNSGFKCASCHDPHAGDSANDRLLRSSIVGWTSGDTVSSTIDFVYDATSLVTTDYASDSDAATAVNEFCGLCHGKFNVADNGAKSLQTGKYRHAMGVPVEADSTTLPVGNYDASSSSTTNLVLCLTCHYPHGSDAAAVSAGYNTWDTDEGTFSGSVLLRADKRDVCYDCHGAASKNTEAYGQDPE